MSRVISRLIRRTASDRSVGAWRCAGRRGVREELITGLLEAAWLRVEHGPLERERERGPFEVESLGGSAALATGDLLVCERHAHIQELPEEDASVEELLDSPLARHGADAASSLIALARALAWSIGQPRTASREGLGLLLSKAISRDLDTLSFDTAPYGYDDAAESLGRITDALINHGSASVGPIIIITAATDAIANVIAVTVANLLDWRAFDDDDDQESVIDLGVAGVHVAGGRLSGRPPPTAAAPGDEFRAEPCQQPTRRRSDGASRPSVPSWTRIGTVAQHR
jgi:hypothetical protein